MKKVLGLFLVAILGGFTAIAIYFKVAGPQQATIIQEIAPSPAARYVTLPSPSSSGSISDFTVAAAKTVNAVVHVKTQSTLDLSDNPWSRFFGYDEHPQVQMGSGSGVIIASDGVVVTNNHVIDGASAIEVSLNSGETYEAELIGTDPSTDLAVLRIQADERLPFMEFGNSDRVQIGEWVLAVGNPFDLTSTVTAGIVSAKARNINLLQYDPNREIFPVESFIQTDAAVNPGNSGGALVNTNGELVGINTAIASRTGSYSGYSFAIPASIAEKVTGDLLKYGGVQRAYIGVVIRDVDEEKADELGMDEIAGIYVTDLSENGAAGEAGIRTGDVILAVNSIPVNSVPALQEQVSKYSPGDKVSVKIWRSGNFQYFPVTLRNRNGQASIVTPEEIKKPDALMALGASFISPSSNELSELGISGGAKINRIMEGKLKTSGVRNGFIITKIDEDPVESPTDITRILAKKQGGILLEGYYPGGKKAYYGFGI